MTEIDSQPDRPFCLVIGPTGAEGSEQRRRYDAVLRHIVAPAIRDVGLEPLQTDKIATPGDITAQVLQALIEAPAVVADLTSANPNVYYEVGVRHSSGRPIVLIAEKGERLPFDVQMRAIFFDHRDLDSAATARELIAAQLREQLEEGADSRRDSGFEGESSAQDVADRGRAEALSWMLRATRTSGAAGEPAGTRAPVQDQLVDLAVAWLRKQWSDTDCPYCQARDWRVGEDVVRLPIFGSERAYPAFPVVCGNCGQTAFINAVQAGLIGPDAT